MLPQFEPVVPGHCIILPLQVGCAGPVAFGRNQAFFKNQPAATCLLVCAFE